MLTMKPYLKKDKWTVNSLKNIAKFQLKFYKATWSKIMMLLTSFSKFWRQSLERNLSFLITFVLFLSTWYMKVKLLKIWSISFRKQNQSNFKDYAQKLSLQL